MLNRLVAFVFVMGLLGGCIGDDGRSSAPPEGATECPPTQDAACELPLVTDLTLDLEAIPPGSDWVILEVVSERPNVLNGSFRHYFPDASLPYPKCGFLLTEHSEFIIAGEPFNFEFHASKVSGEPIVDQHALLRSGWVFTVPNWKSEIPAGASYLLYGHSEAEAWREEGGSLQASLEFETPVRLAPVATGDIHCVSDAARMRHDTYISNPGMFTYLRGAEHHFGISGIGLGLISIDGNQGYEMRLDGPNGTVEAVSNEGPQAPPTRVRPVLAPGDYTLSVPRMDAVNGYGDVRLALVDVPAPYAARLQGNVTGTS